VHGLTFAPRAIAIFDELRRAAQELTIVASGARGTLRIGTVPMPAIPFLPIAIKRLVEAHPGIFVSVVEERESELVDRLRKRDVELAILRMSLFDPDEDMQVTQLFEEKLCVIAAKDHPLAGRKQLTWPQILAERWVMPPADCYFFEHVLRTLDTLGLALPRHAVESFSVHMQHGMVLHGGMLSFGMRSPVEFAPDKALLVQLPVQMPSVAGDVGAVTLMEHAASPLAQQLVGHIRDLASSVRAARASEVQVPSQV